MNKSTEQNRARTRQQYMPLRLDIFEDPSISTLQTALKTAPNTIVGALCRLWIWANRNLTDGVARGCDFDALDEVCALRYLSENLAKIGWLRRVIRKKHNGRVDIVFVRFNRWNAQSLRRRQLAAERQRRKRDKMSRSCHAHVTRAVTRKCHASPVICNTTQIRTSLSSPRPEDVSTQVDLRDVAVGAMTRTGVSVDTAETLYERHWSQPPQVWQAGESEANNGEKANPAGWWTWYLQSRQSDATA